MRLSMLAFAALLWAARADAQTALSIASVSPSTVATFGALTVSGAGFDPAAGAISVIVAPRGGVAAVVPVHVADALSVRIFMPPLVEAATSGLFDVPVVADIQAVQVTSDSVSTSNVLGGLTIEPLPRLPATLAPGRMTKAFLQMTDDVNGSVRTALGSSPTFAGVVRGLQAFARELTDLADAAASIAGNQERTVALRTTTGDALVVTARSLAVSDRIALGLVRQAVGQLSRAAAPSGGFALAPRAMRCATETRYDVPEPLHREVCSLAGQYDGLAERGPDMVRAGAAVVYGLPLAMIGGLTAAGLGAAELVGSTVATAMSVLTGPVVSHAAAYHTGASPPAVGSTLTDVGTALLDTFALGGLPVASGLNAAVSMVTELEKAANAPRGPSPTVPRGGLVVTAVPQPAPAGTRAVTAIQPTATGPASTDVGAPTGPQLVPFATAKLPLLSVSRFNGSYTGSITGSCTVPTPIGPVTSGAQGPLNFDVANGVVSGAGPPTGTVAATGQINPNQVVVAGATCTWGGRLWGIDQGAAAGGSGSWACQVPAVATACGGSWTVTRLAR